MKKLFLSIILMTTVSVSLFAQKANVSRAENLAMQEKPDFKAAREAIKSAFNDEKTKNDAKTYYVAGLIGYQENEDFIKSLMLGKTVDQTKKGKAIMEAYDYFLKAYDLDQQPDAKGRVRPKHSKKIKDNIKEDYKNLLTRWHDNYGDFIQTVLLSKAFEKYKNKSIEKIDIWMDET